MKQVVVMCGGISVERDVSLRSGASVADAAKKAGFQTQLVDLTDIALLKTIPRSAIVLPILHGAYGEDGKLQHVLETQQYAFLGSGSKSSQNCFDKSVSRSIFAKAHIPIAKGETVHSFDEYRASGLQLEPHVLKVANGGSSIGTYIVRDPHNLDQSKAQTVFHLESKAVVERLIEGTEITVPILGNEALPVIEIMPPENQEFDYANKYNGTSKELCPALSLSTEIQSKAQMLALQVHKTMDCRDLSRVDMIVSPHGDLYVLEINTMPGMTTQSLYPLSAKVFGLAMPDLIKSFVSLAEMH